MDWVSPEFAGAEDHGIKVRLNKGMVKSALEKRTTRNGKMSQKPRAAALVLIRARVLGPMEMGTLGLGREERKVRKKKRRKGGLPSRRNFSGSCHLHPHYRMEKEGKREERKGTSLVAGVAT